MAKSAKPRPKASPKAQPKERPGGRSARVLSGVLRAAAEELADSGYAGFRVERVAAAAGVNRSTIYRRWPDKVQLIEEAVRALKVVDMPDRGSLLADIEVMVEGLKTRAESPEWRAVLRVMTTEMHHPEVQAMSLRLRAHFQAPWLACVRRAVARGELPAATDPRVLIDALTGAIFFRFLRSGAFDDAFARKVTRLVITGAAHGGATE